MKKTAADAAKEIFSSALKAADPCELTRLHTGRVLQAFREGGYERLIVTGFGKAAYAMALAVEDHAGEAISAGLVITKYGHGGTERLKKITVAEAGHPVPDEEGVRATEEIIRLLRDADAKTLVLCLISGGGSSLLVSPWEGISLEEKQKLTRMLLRAGADIQEINTLRKHISRVKGGRLAEIASPARIISLILSDVIGDRLDVIASGPTAPDQTTYHEAWEVLKKFNLRERAPLSVLHLLDRGRDGLIPETPKQDSPVFQRVENIIIGSNRKALEAAREKAITLGYATELSPEPVTGEAREAGRRLAQRAMEIKRTKESGTPLCLISGGETTVTVTGNGKGGRNTELALAFALEAEGTAGITLLSAGTDGTDGPTDAAGAIVDGRTITNARNMGLDPLSYLNNNDSYTFFREAGGLLITGPTGTNVMDIQVVVVE